MHFDLEEDPQFVRITAMVANQITKNVGLRVLVAGRDSTGTIRGENVNVAISDYEGNCSMRHSILALERRSHR